MDVPMSWLKEYAAVTAPLKDFMEDMTMSGSKVEGATSGSYTHLDVYKRQPSTRIKRLS